MQPLRVVEPPGEMGGMLRGANMNFIKPIGAAETDKSAETEVEGNIRELVRRDSTAFRQADGDAGRR
jgi:hypothetical protein